MQQPYEIVDSLHPEWSGMRFASMERAEQELAKAVPPGRFFIRDRSKKVQAQRFDGDHSPEDFEKARRMEDVGRY